ncbi:MAG: hypothetical protein M1826_000634 [Phylliscum demangeonii]|nr:MAG: hypothetical protein M1826_000634 [Phylliscum demangeonii]
MLLGLVMSASILLPDSDPPICPARPKIGPGAAPAQLTPADNLEAIFVVETDVRLACQSTGTDKLVPGEWDVTYLSGADVHDYGKVLRRQTRFSVFGMEVPSFFHLSPSPRRIVLPSMKDVLSLSSDKLDKHTPTEHSFVTAKSGEHYEIFTGTTAPTPPLWLPEAITDPVFIAPKAADAMKEVAIKAYRIWGNLEPRVSGVCATEGDNLRSAHYRALFLLYGRGNSVRDDPNGFHLPPVCKESGDKVLTGGRRAGGRWKKLAFLAKHQARLTTK